MRVRIRFYATAREAVGARSVTLAFDGSARTLDDLLGELRSRWPALRPILPTCRIARNGGYLSGNGIALADGDELAVHPPFSGG